MVGFHRALAVLFTIFLGLGVLSRTPRAFADTLPARLDDREFWRIIEQFSEPDGYFRSDNLLSNEAWLQHAIPDLLLRTRPGGVYMGVGPEQNFTYIAALRPKVAFITDIRRGNLHTHFMYKALFELSSDRADFVSRLFSRPRPEGLGPNSSVTEIFEAFASAPTSDDAAFKENSKAVREHLIKKRALPLSNDDLQGIEYVYHNFYLYGPGINYSSSGQSFGGRRGNFVTYADLMAHTDGNGVARSYLATEENFEFVKSLQERNLIVPIVGDFGGSKAIRAIGEYLRRYHAIVTAFYLSNVEQYLGSVRSNFCSNVATLPLDDKSTFIRASRGGGGPYGGLTPSLGDMQAETRACAVTP